LENVGRDSKKALWPCEKRPKDSSERSSKLRLLSSSVLGRCVNTGVIGPRAVGVGNGTPGKFLTPPREVNIGTKGAGFGRSSSGNSLSVLGGRLIGGTGGTCLKLPRPFNLSIF